MLVPLAFERAGTGKKKRYATTTRARCAARATRSPPRRDPPPAPADLQQPRGAGDHDFVTYFECADAPHDRGSLAIAGYHWRPTIMNGTRAEAYCRLITARCVRGRWRAGSVACGVGG